MKPRIPKISPGRILLVSFLFTIGMGTFLLSLQKAQLSPIPLIDVMFTATSATCVTGLKTVPISKFTMFGKCVILALIQIGGLGLMTLSFFLASLFLNLGMTTQLIAGQILEFEFWNRVKPFMMLIIGITFLAEFFGTIILYTQFINLPIMEDPLFSAFFHSVSSFCNAGMSLLDNGLVDFATNPTVITTFGILMFAGSIGFIVWYDFARLIKTYLQSFRGSRAISKLSLHTKIVLASSLFLSLFCGGLFWFLENELLLSGLTIPQKALNSLFTGFSARGIGYKTVELNNASLPTLLLFLPMMFIGASPGSTGSGIKTTTFVIFAATVFAILKNRESVEIRGRSIPNDQVYKVVAIIAIGVFWIFTTTFLLLLTEKNFSFIQVLYQSVSAFGCCGLSTGITPNMSFFGKIILSITMVIGRIGSLTLVLALRRQKIKHHYKFPEERVMIG